MSHREMTILRGAALLALASTPSWAQQVARELARDARVQWASAPEPARATDAAPAAAPAVAALQRHVDWNDDGRVDLLRLDADGGLELYLAREDGELVEADLDLPAALEVPLARFALIQHDGRASLDLVLFDRSDRPRVLHRRPGGHFRVELDLWEPARARSVGDREPAVAQPRSGASGGIDGPGGASVADAVRDRADLTSPIAASSLPVLGDLYPLSSDLYVDSTGVVGMGTTSPDDRLTVEGGDVLVDGGFSIGLPGAEEVLVREAFDGRPTVELRDAAGQTTLTIGESSLTPGTRAGLELVDPVSGRPLYRSAATDGVELTDAGTGALALRLTSDELSAFNEAEVRTLRLQGGPGDVDAQLLDGDGVEVVRLDTDTGGFGGVRLRIQGLPGGEDLQIGRRMLSPDGSQAEARLSVGNAIELSSSRPGGVADAGSLLLRDGLGNDALVLDGLAPSGGPELTLSDDTDHHVRLIGEGPFGAPSVEVLEPGGALVGRIEGDNGPFLESGAITMYDGGTGTPTVSLNGDVSGGGMLAVSTTDGVDLVRLDAATAGIYLRYANGITGSSLVGSLFQLFDENGVQTISYDGQTGSKNAVATTRDFGARYLYAIESPEIWFEDAGNGRLQSGAQRVELDPVFLETVTIDRQEPLLVFVTPTGPCAGLWVEPDAAGFTVRERSGGTSSATFDWRVLARRKGFEGARLEGLGVAGSPAATTEREDS